MIGTQADSDNPVEVELHISDDVLGLALRTVLSDHSIDITDKGDKKKTVLVTDNLSEVTERAILVVDETAFAARHALLLMRAGRLQSAIPCDRPRDLPLAIDVLRAGFTAMPTALQKRAALAPDLRERDVAILSLVIKGTTNSDIADALFVSEASVKRYVSSLMVKFRASSRVDLAQRAVKAGFNTLLIN